MKRILIPIFSLVALAGPVLAQPLTSATPVIGFYKFDVPVGTSIWTCGLVTKKDFQGAATSMTAGATSVITSTTAAWPAFPLHYAEILSGPQTGLILDILSNTATTITVKGNTASFGLTGTEQFCIRAHATLGTVFKDGGGLTAGTDFVTLIGETGRKTYAFNGSFWEDEEVNDANNIIVYPGQAFLITHSAGTTATVTFGGDKVAYVKSGPTKIPLYPGIPNLIGSPNPLVSTNVADPYFAASSSTLGAYGFVQGLQAGSDFIEIRSNTGALASQGVFSSNGSFIEDSELNDGGTVPVRNGTGLIISVSGSRLMTVPSLLPAGN
jgi:hypothetical protein